MRKIMIKQNFASEGRRYLKGCIVGMTEEKITKFKAEGLVEEVSVALGVECEGGDVDLSEYVTRTQLEEMKPSLKGDRGEKGERGETGAQGIQGIQGEKGAKGDKGDKGDSVKGDKGDKGDKGADGFPTQEQWEALLLRVQKLEEAQPASVSEEPKTKAKAKK